MLSISNLTSIMDKQFNGKEISPADLESKLRAVNSALEIYNDSNLSIRFSFGEPIDDEKSLDDWKEIECLELKKIPADRQNMKYTLYEVWYDDEEGFIEAMLYLNA